MKGHRRLNDAVQQMESEEMKKVTVHAKNGRDEDAGSQPPCLPSQYPRGLISSGNDGARAA